MAEPVEETGVAEARAFVGVRFDPIRAETALGDVIAPPYDSISPPNHAALLARSPWNIVRIDAPFDVADPTTRYTVAAARYRDWLARGVLRRDPERSLYVHDYAFWLDGERRRRRAVFAAVRLTPWDTGQVLPHELTFPGPRQDRLALLRAAPVNVSPLFGLYADPTGVAQSMIAAITARTPDQSTTDPDGGEHQLWRETDPARHTTFAAALASQPIFIADGHHRYEAALAYRDEQRARFGEDPGAPWEFVLIGLVEMNDPGLAVLPVHRVLRSAPRAGAAALASLADRFPIERRALTTNDDLNAALARLADLDHHGAAIGVVTPPGDECWLLSGPATALDAEFARQAVIEAAFGVEPAAQESALWFTRDAAEAVAATRSGEAVAALLLNPVTLDTLTTEALAGRRMPQKSTYFYPKAPTGLVLRPIEA